MGKALRMQGDSFFRIKCGRGSTRMPLTVNFLI